MAVHRDYPRPMRLMIAAKRASERKGSHFGSILMNQLAARKQRGEDEFMNHREAKREAQRMQSNREELVERMARVLPEDGSLEALPGFFLGRSSKPTESVQSVYQPAFCFVVQGGKRVLLDEELFRYDPGHYFNLHGRFANRLPGRRSVERTTLSGFPAKPRSFPRRLSHDGIRPRN